MPRQGGEEGPQPPEAPALAKLPAAGGDWPPPSPVALPLREPQPTDALCLVSRRHGNKDWLTCRQADQEPLPHESLELDVTDTEGGRHGRGAPVGRLALWLNPSGPDKFHGPRNLKPHQRLHLFDLPKPLCPRG